MTHPTIGVDLCLEKSMKISVVKTDVRFVMIYCVYIYYIYIWFHSTSYNDMSHPSCQPIPGLDLRAPGLVSRTRFALPGTSSLDWTPAIPVGFQDLPLGAVIETSLPRMAQVFNAFLQ